MKHFKCENCGSDLVKCADNAYVCDYCKREYYDDSLEKAYERVYRNLQVTIDGIVSEKLMEQRIEQLANCRQALYKARNGQFIDSKEVEKWSGEILKLSPDDVQANFYGIACKKRWIDLNKFMQKLNARENSYLVEGFVDYLTNGQFVEKCVLALNDLISRAFDENSKEFSNCHKKINKAAEEEESGIFDAELSRDVFVAYSSKDKDEAYKLVEYLEKNGLSCFIAMRNLAKGVDAEHKYNERLKKAIDNCQVFVLVSSKNSRSRDCDAYNIEMRYVKERDISRAENREYANAHYELYLEKNRRRCKPRVEYLIDKYQNGLYDKEVKKFFGGLTWCTSLNSVGKVVFDYIENGTVDDEEEKLAKQRAEIEEERKKLEKKEKELSKKQAEQADSIDDLYKAFKQRERDEEEQRRKEELERKAKAELERQRKIQEEIERQREVEREQKEAETRALKEKQEAERKRKEEEERKRQAELEAKRKLQQEERRRRKEQEEFERTFSIKGNTLMEYNGESAICVVPDNVKDFHSKCFSNAKHLEKVILPTGITKINNGLFKGLKHLKSVECRGQVTGIGDFAFSGCTSLTEFSIPEMVATIGKNTFENCSKLTKIDFPNGLSCIPEKAFKGCISLSNIIIPESIESVGERAFEGCASLTEMEFPKYVSFGDAVLSGCNALESLTLHSLESLSFQNLFASKQIKSLKHLKLIEGKALEGTSLDGLEGLERIEIPASVGRIENQAFKALPSLICIGVEDDNAEYRSIDGNLYTKDGKTLVKYANGKKDEVFEISDNVTTIEGRAFEGCRLKKIIIPASVNRIYSYAFAGCGKLTEVHIKDVSAWCDICFDSSYANPLKYGANLYLNGELVTDLAIPDDVIRIKDYAFYGYSSLKSVSMPASVQRIEGFAFENCENLKEVHIQGEKVEMTEKAFVNCENLSKQSRKNISRCMPFAPKIKFWAVWAWALIVAWMTGVAERCEPILETLSDWFEGVADFIVEFRKVFLGVAIAVVVAILGIGLKNFSWTTWQWIIGVIVGLALLFLVYICYKELLLWNTVANMSIYLAIAILNGVALFFLKEYYEIIFGCISVCEILAGAIVSIDRCKGELSLEAIENGRERDEPKIGECIIQILITVLALVGMIIGLIFV